MMEWGKLLSKDRLNSIEGPQHEESRSTFQRDFDRIVFSAAFRRMQDKTQVFPLSEKNDYIRTRLTHSLEVSCVGRSLGTLIGKHVLDNNAELRGEHHESDFGTIVSAACLAHDIGNPPLGHSGEEAVRHWFEVSEYGKAIVDRITEDEKNDFLKFEGNAQGFRSLVRLQNRAAKDDGEGGLKLTCAVLAAFTKYPRFSVGKKDEYRNKNVCAKKYGIYKDDADAFRKLAKKVGLVELHDKHEEWSRHPLAYLVEAADDILRWSPKTGQGAKL